MFKFFLFNILLLGLIAVSPVYATTTKNPTPMLTEYRATYRISWRHFPVATSYHHLYKLAPNKYVAEVNSFPNLFAIPYNATETSVFIQKKNQLFPLNYIYEIVEKTVKKGETIFDWNNKKIQLRREHNPTAELNLPENLHDQITEHLQLRLHLQEDLKKGGIKSSYRYSVIDQDTIKSYQFNLVGEEILKTPLGELSAVKFEHISQNQKRTTTIWLARDLNFLLIKLQQMRKDILMIEGDIEIYDPENK